MKKRIVIATLIDWSKSFVDENGSFYCGATHEEKTNATRVAERADLVIFSTDLHPLTSEEFAVNGGLYPVHNLLHSIENYLETTSPELTAEIARTLRDRAVGLIVPKDVYFQGVAKPWSFAKEIPWTCSEEIEGTFGANIINVTEFVSGDYSYIIAPKKYFDATRLDSDINMPKGGLGKMPCVNYNVYSLLRDRYPPAMYELVFANTGVVEGICRLHTSVGLKQMFPSSRVINVTDATTPLVGPSFGFGTVEQSKDAYVRMCKDVGIEHMSTEEFLKVMG